MSAVSEDERWRLRFEELARQLDAQSAEHVAQQAHLRRIVQRLCLASRGMSERLDAVLDQLADAVRQPGDAQMFESLLAELSNAVAQAEPPALLAAQQRLAPDDRPLRVALLQIVGRLEADPALQQPATELRSRLESGSGLPLLVDTCAGLGDLIAAQRERLEHDQADLQRVLQQVDTRLHDFLLYLRGEASERQAAEQSRSELDSGLLGDVRELSQNVAQASDLSQLRLQVGRQLESIDRHLHAFRAREAERAAQFQQRAERMRVKVEQLEHETRTLQASLQREQINASTDPLTGIPNRLAYEQRIALEFKRWKRFGRPLALAVWDIDSFKQINDRHGHRIGDRVIRAVGRLLASQVRETDFVARYGGEEFVAVLVDAGAEAALVASEKLRLALAALAIDGGEAGVLAVTASCGIAEFGNGDDPDRVFERADRALYAAKEAGRNRCMVDGAGAG
jgi:diguanylate cyclase